MKNKFRIILCSIALFIASPVFAGIVIGVDGNYMSQTNHRTDNNATTTTLTANGYAISPSARYEFNLVPLVKLGIGAYVGLGAVNPTLDVGVTSDKVTWYSFGGDFWLTLDLPIFIKPFARVMLGRYSAQETSTIPTTLGTYEVVGSATALQYNFLIGFKFAILPFVDIYAQGGYAGTGNAKPSLDSATLNGAPTTVTQTTTNVYSSGYIFGAGVMLSF